MKSEPRRRAAWLCALLVAGSPLVANAEPGVSSDKIVFGQAAALEGPAAQLGLDMQAGIRAAFEEANKAGGVKGRKLELLSLDDG
jgi:ABC-type branched-subunit amino acid transport system substrate-binding protein